MADPEKRLTRREVLPLVAGGSLLAILTYLGLRIASDSNAPGPATPDQGPVRVSPTPEISGTQTAPPERGFQLFDPIPAEGFRIAEEPDVDMDFSKEPNGRLNPQYWSHELGVLAGHEDEAQIYTDELENSRVENGMLVVESRINRNPQMDKPFTAAWVNTRRKLDIMYGRIEARIRHYDGIGPVNAFWLRSTDQTNSQNASPEDRQSRYRWALNGELDIMEVLAARRNLVYSNAHTKASLEAGDQPNSRTIEVPTMYNQFHTYAMEWYPDRIYYFVDDLCYNAILKPAGPQPVSVWPYDHPYHVVLSTAMGRPWSVSAAPNYPNGVNLQDEGKWRMDMQSFKYFPLQTT